MEIAAFVISCIAFIGAVFSIGWNVWTWRHSHRFDVRVRIEHEFVVVGSGKYEITVVVENLGATEEAVQAVYLLYPEHEHEEGEARLGPMSLRDTGLNLPLPPRRNVKRTYDLLAPRFAPLPYEVTAYVSLQSGGGLIASEPFKTSAEGFAVAMAGRSLSAAAEAEQQQ